VPYARCAVVFVIAVLLAGCQYGIWNGWDPAFDVATLTLSAAGDSYKLTYQQPTDAVTVTAPKTNKKEEGRGVFWPAGQAPLLDGESCARWNGENPSYPTKPGALPAQEGAALRIRTNPDGSRDAITVTKNIFLGAIWIFNEHTWDTNQKAPVFTQIGQVDLQPVFDPSGDVTKPSPLPWDLCAQVVGPTLSFVAWLDNTPRPAYGDLTHGGSVQLPTRYVHPGQVGWYIGHLHPGQSALFDHRSAQDVTSPPSSTTSTTTASVG
jgi:hypothetical protein